MRCTCNRTSRDLNFLPPFLNPKSWQKPKSWQTNQYLQYSNNFLLNSSQRDPPKKIHQKKSSQKILPKNFSQKIPPEKFCQKNNYKYRTWRSKSFSSLLCLFFYTWQLRKRHRKRCTWKSFWPFLFWNCFSPWLILHLFTIKKDLSALRQIFEVPS